MGFFSLKEVCGVCEQETGLNRFRIADKKWVCNSCFKKANLKKIGANEKAITKMTVDDIKNAILVQKENAVELENFNPTKKIGSFIEFDDINQKWLILSSFLGKRNKSTVYNYSDIVDFELLEDGESVSSGGLGRAVVGGALFGGAGAIVGGVTGQKTSNSICTSLRIKITLNDINKPTVYVELLKTATKKNHPIYKKSYKQAQECLSVLQLICNQQQPVTAIPEQQSVSAADEILKYKNLLDIGAITQEEFDEKKIELLNK